MPHIHTEPGQHDQTVSAFIIRLDTKEPMMVLHRHKKLGRLMQFGGHVELHETPWQAVIHEIAEESGYHLDQLMLLQPKRRLMYVGDDVLHPQPVSILTHRFGDTDHFHTDITYAFVTYEAPSSPIQDQESTEIELLSAAELADAPPEAIFESIRSIGLYVFDECLPNWTLVKPNSYSS